MWFLVFGGWSGELNLAARFLFNSSLPIKKRHRFYGYRFSDWCFLDLFWSERVLAFYWV
nr:hypothetical protein [uncultured Flavobacterium sp.]